jgi:hypothetical protein
VEHQLWENGGSSLADRVNTIEMHSIKTTTELEFIKELIINGSTPVAAVKKPRARKTA